MEISKQKWGHYGWFIGGFLVGLTLISLGHAALPPSSGGISEIQGRSLPAPDLEQDLAHLNSLESKYTESLQQQQRLKAATQKAAHAHLPRKKKNSVQ